MFDIIHVTVIDYYDYHKCKMISKLENNYYSTICKLIPCSGYAYGISENCNYLMNTLIT